MSDLMNDQNVRDQLTDDDVSVMDEDNPSGNPSPRPDAVNKGYRPFNALRARELRSSGEFDQPGKAPSAS